MECILQVVRGDSLEVSGKICPFCGSPAEYIFGITNGKKYDGTVFKGFGVCEEHKDRLNAILSGDFDIDDIYLEQYRKVAAKKLHIRQHPPLSVAKTDNNKKWKVCAFSGCENKFKGIAVQKYCKDPRCIEMRKEALKSKVRKTYKDPDAKNLIIDKKKTGIKLKNSQILNIRCRATDCRGKRCTNTFRIQYQNNRSVYPMFCEEHRSAYKRHRFSTRGNTNAKSVSPGTRRIKRR